MTNTLLPGKNVRENMSINVKNTDRDSTNSMALGKLHRVKDRGGISLQVSAPEILNQKRPSAGLGKLRLTSKLVQKSIPTAHLLLSGCVLNSIR